MSANRTTPREEPPGEPRSEPRLLETGGPKALPPPPGFRGTRLAYLGALAGGLAHEIKNPLSTIALNLGLLREDWQNPANPKETRTLKKIELLEREARRLGSIVEEFLSFARGEDYKFDLLDLNSVVREILDFTEAENQRAGVRVLFDSGESLPKLSIDRDHLKQAILNLVTNARQAMPSGGELLLRTRLEAEAVTLEVTDTGVGMSPEVRARCFELFFSSRRGGNGYGLSLTKRILEEHGGQIDVWSEVGRGTRFTIRFPIPQLSTDPSPQRSSVPAGAAAPPTTDP
jgi:two-component system, NtrC family, sensor histidine kinase HydH